MLTANPDDVLPAAVLFERFGLARESEAAYRTYLARNPKQPERVLALIGFLVRQIGHRRPSTFVGWR